MDSLPHGPFDDVYTAASTRDDRALRRACAAGRLVRVRRGAFVDASRWKTASHRERYLLQVRAVAASRGLVDVLSHESAAAVLGLPLLRHPELVHTVSPTARSTRTTAGLVIHAAALDPADREPCWPLETTSAARTVADLVLERPFRDGVAVLDGALRLGLTERALVSARVEASLRRTGRVTAARALAFADAAAANPGESLSRVVLAELGFEVPLLQHRFDDEDGLIGYADFYWPSTGVVGEFDGLEKYSGAGMLRGRAPSEVVVAGKRRQDRLQAHPAVRSVTRWVWSDLSRPEALGRQLARAGVPSWSRRS